MQLLFALILGVVQGLTEFLPISSSAHLLLIREVFGESLLGNAHWDMIFDVSAHVGTFLAVLLYFRVDVIRLVRAFFATFRRGLTGVPEGRLPWILLLGTVPGALAGWLGEETIEGIFRQQPLLMATLLIAFGILLWLADHVGRKVRELPATGWADGILIGCAQALALAPGVSRSGITMTTGLLRGMTRETAARFSFLLSLPIMAGAAIFGLHKIVTESTTLPPSALSMFAVGLVAAGISGYLCIHYFLQYLRTKSLTPFVWYRVVLGLVLIGWFAIR